MYHLTLPNDIETISQLNEFIDGFCEETGISKDVCMSLNLAIEEAVVNVMNYAYPMGTVGYVDIEAEADKKVVTFVISDTGQPFDPTKEADADITLPAEKRPVGGLGIHLVRHIMDSISYEYADHRNILTLRKIFNKQEVL
ncbi:MAG: ATP-binding protein [Prevotella sp.]|nr:ATP-binding protein [Prevotella sp.]